MNMNDKTLYYASQIAYFNFDKELKDGIKDNGPLTLQQAFETYATDLYENANDKQRAFYDRIKNGEEFYSDWQMLRIDDQNAETGYYSMVLLPPESETAIVAFRGSETGDGQFMLDWILADAMLITGLPTAQQNKAKNVMDEILNDSSLSDYNFITTGHSLGGNLAMHATIQTTSDRILSCTALDAPSFAQEYYNAYEDLLNANASKINHYSWSLVGILFLPKFTTATKGVNPEVYNDIFGKHNLLNNYQTPNLIFDTNGNLISGEIDFISIYMAAFVLTIDMSDSPELYTLFDKLFLEVIYLVLSV